MGKHKFQSRFFSRLKTDKPFCFFTGIFIVEAILAVMAEIFYYGKNGFSVDQALALFVIISSITLFCFRKKCPTTIRDCCVMLGIGSVFFSMFGVAVQYELFPGASCFQNIGLTFVPIATVYSVFCGAMLAFLQDDSKAHTPPEKTNEEDEK